MATGVNYTGRMQEALVAYLEAKQAELKLSSFAMAQRLGISESNWGHIRRSRRRLPSRVLGLALTAFPELAEVIAEHAEPGDREQVPA